MLLILNNMHIFNIIVLGFRYHMVGLFITLLIIIHVVSAYLCYQNEVQSEG